MAQTARRLKEKMIEESPYPLTTKDIRLHFGWSQDTTLRWMKRLPKRMYRRKKNLRGDFEIRREVIQHIEDYIKLHQPGHS
jgi:hypothetical protein